ncbi:N-methyl-L-tryptophan oxidase [Halalkalibacillus halophilus]|uniref:N-methyl-L-tryptophan oxidase n=1 Tax=Halalkalibacillus halophilus TaxID=392827 RepID=UPI0003F83ECC|nr:N-methyl-L-tryptophan oxidase [Halalkalibacillus halophilus]
MNFDVIIIGAGSMGMAAGYYLAKQNKKVLLIDSNQPPHSEGSHHGDTRLIRHAYGEGDSYVPMALRAQELWYELEELSGEELFVKTGVLNIGDPNSSFIKNVQLSSELYNLSVETLTSSEINRRWPGFDINSELIGCFERNSGVLMSDRIVQVYRDLALNAGATLLTSSRVEAIESSQGSVNVRADGETYTSEQLIVTAGKGTNQILSLLDKKLPLQPVRKTFSWFTSDEVVYGEDKFPGWAYDAHGHTFYGFPSVEGEGLKIGRHDGGRALPDPTQLKPFGSYSEDEQEVSDQASRIFSQLTPHREGKVCTYTNTPDGDFIIDHLPTHPNITVACGFSGHGFKFASVIGEILVDLSLKGKTEIDLSPFTMDRF